MNNMPNLRPSYDEFEDVAEQFDELIGELEVLDEFEGDNPFLEFEEEGEWQSEVNRQSRDFIRWLQNSLNKILELKLKVDGLMGPQTRSAIRNFQQRQGLSVDGIVNPKTEAAIKTLGSTPTTTVPPSDIPAYTQCDFIHPNIDVAAQYALYGMLKSDTASRNASVQMLTAVKTGRHGGIFQEDQKVPAMRAVQLGLGWYGPLISKYRRSVSSAACIPPAPHPSHKVEIISFKKSLAKNLAELGRQLSNVWLDCAASKLRLPPVLPRGGVCNRPPKPIPPEIPPKKFQQKLCVNPSELILVDERYDKYYDPGKKVTGTLFLQSCGDGELDWVVNSTEPRLTVDPKSGLAHSRRQQINVTWDTRGLPVNKEYSKKLIFSPRYALAEEKIVQVKLYIVERGRSTAIPGTKKTKPFLIASDRWITSKIYHVTANCGGRAVKFVLKNLNLVAPAFVTINANNGEEPQSRQVPISGTELEFKNLAGITTWNFEVDAIPALGWGNAGALDSEIAWSLYCIP